MAAGPTQSITEMSTKYLSGGKGRTAHKVDNLKAICEQIVYKWEPRRPTTPRASKASYRYSFVFFTYKHMILIKPFNWFLLNCVSLIEYE
jgi:hypothetical protein